MKYIATLLIAVFLSNAAIAATSTRDAVQVYKRLIAANGIRNAPPLYVTNEGSPNASSSRNGITINTGMLRFAKNKDELARVLGHELGHYKLHHNRSSVPNEYAADRMAARYMKGSGYNICKGSLLLKRRNASGGTTHPADILRYKAFHCS